MAAHQFHVDGRNGDIAVTDHGGQGNPVLFVHSPVYSAEQWTATCWELTHHARALTMDLRGHGRSRSDHGSFHVIWQDIADVVVKADLRNLVIVVQDLLGSAVRKVAAELPDRVVGVLCINDPRMTTRDELEKWGRDVLAFTTEPKFTNRVELDAAGPDAQSMEEFLDRTCEKAETDWLLDDFGGRRREVVKAMLLVNDDGSWRRRPGSVAIANGIRTLDFDAMEAVNATHAPPDLPLWFLDSTFPDRNREEQPHTPKLEQRTNAARYISIDAGTHPECSHPEEVARLTLELSRAGVQAAQRRSTRPL